MRLTARCWTLSTRAAGSSSRARCSTDDPRSGCASCPTGPTAIGSTSASTSCVRGRRPSGELMPELPEIRAPAGRLPAAVGGATFGAADLLSFSSLKTVTPRATELTGRVLDRIGRRGKYLVFELGGPRMLVHLSQGGRIDVEDPPKATKPRGAVVRLR